MKERGHFMLEKIRKVVFIAKLPAIVLVLLLSLVCCIVYFTWHVEGVITSKYIIPAYTVSVAGTIKENPEQLMIRMKISTAYEDSIGLFDEWETEVTKEIYNNSEIGDTYFKDFKNSERIIKKQSSVMKIVK
jgi:hypothetical protein